MNKISTFTKIIGLILTVAAISAIFSAAVSAKGTKQEVKETGAMQNFEYTVGDFYNVKMTNYDPNDTSKANLKITFLKEDAENQSKFLNSLVAKINNIEIPQIDSFGLAVLVAGAIILFAGLIVILVSFKKKMNADIKSQKSNLYFYVSRK